MKLVRFGPQGHEKPGCLDDSGQLRDLSAIIADFGGDSVSCAALDALRQIDLNKAPVVEGQPRLGAPLAFVPNFYCIGLNYALHAAETGAATPAEPILFSKASGCLSGPQDPILLPRGSEKTDWEAELGVVIGTRAYRITEAEALDYVAGYCAVNDLSEREYQFNHGGQWIKGKSCPGFGKIGPVLVTKDEITNPQALGLRLWVNDILRQDSTTADMIFPVAQIISHMSHYMELLPGDIIATGTPSGVGMGLSPPQFLQAGDHVRLAIDSLGAQACAVMAP
jgi:2,4-didehydro-3-deoxy-L-rhamnonate hydrolase